MLNTKIVEVFFANNIDTYKYGKRQIPLIVEDCPTFIMQFDDLISSSPSTTSSTPTTSCIACDEKQLESNKQFNINNNKLLSSTSKKDYDLFMNKYNKLLRRNSSLSSSSNDCTCNSNNDFILESTQADVNDTLAKLITCIGCRTSVERFLKQLIQSSNSNNLLSNALDPFIIVSSNKKNTQQVKLTLSKEYLRNPYELYKLFYLDVNKLDSLIERTAKFSCSNGRANSSGGKKSHLHRRCYLHSLDMQKQKSISDWLPVWDLFSNDELRKRSIIIDTSQLLYTLDNYLRKHKFCSDCKTKVIRAFNLLTGELDSSKEKGYCASLYEGIECCSQFNQSSTNDTASSCSNPKHNHSSHSHQQQQQQHLYLKNDKQFIWNLIYKAEPEIQGNRRERHAKTIDIAQEEVLTCIGIHLYERFHRIYNAIKLEEQTWLLLYYTCVITLKKSFELEFEKIQGVSNLDLICAELAAIDASNNSRKQVKKERKKQRKITKSQNLAQLTNTTTNENSSNSKDLDEETVILSKNQLVSLSSCVSNEKRTNSSNDKNKKAMNSTGSSKTASCNSSSTDLIDIDLRNRENEVEDEPDEDDEEENLPDFEYNLVNDCENVENSNEKVAQELDMMKCGCQPDECNYDEIITNKQTNLLKDFSSLSSSSSSSSSASPYSPANSFYNDTIDFFGFNNNFESFENTIETLKSMEDYSDQHDMCSLITEEEKKEYYANKSDYLIKRKIRREQLEQKFKNLKLNANFRVKPRIAAYNLE